MGQYLKDVYYFFYYSRIWENCPPVCYSQFPLDTFSRWSDRGVCVIEKNFVIVARSATYKGV